MVRLEQRLTDVLAKDPAVASWAAFVGGGRPLNNGFVILGLKPRDERDATADQIIDASAQEARRRCPAARCSCRPRRT